MADVYQVDLTAGAGDWPEGKRWQWREQMMYVFPQGWAPVVRLPLTTMQWRLLLALIHHCDWGNKCRVTSAQLGRDIGVHRSTTLRALRVLALHQLLLLETSPRQSDQTIVLSPTLCWKGRPWHLAHARRQFLAAWRLRYTTESASDSVAVAPAPSLHALPRAVLPVV